MRVLGIYMASLAARKLIGNAKSAAKRPPSNRPCSDVVPSSRQSGLRPPGIAGSRQCSQDSIASDFSLASTSFAQDSSRDSRLQQQRLDHHGFMSGGGSRFNNLDSETAATLLVSISIPAWDIHKLARIMVNRSNIGKITNKVQRWAEDVKTWDGEKTVVVHDRLLAQDFLEIDAAAGKEMQPLYRRLQAAEQKLARSQMVGKARDENDDGGVASSRPGSSLSLLAGPSHDAGKRKGSGDDERSDPELLARNKELTEALAASDKRRTFVERQLAKLRGSKSDGEAGPSRERLNFNATGALKEAEVQTEQAVLLECGVQTDAQPNAPTLKKGKTAKFNEDANTTRLIGARLERGDTTTSFASSVLKRGESTTSFASSFSLRRGESTTSFASSFGGSLRRGMSMKSVVSTASTKSTNVSNVGSRVSKMLSGISGIGATLGKLGRRLSIAPSAETPSETTHLPTLAALNNAASQLPPPSTNGRRMSQGPPPCTQGRRGSQCDVIAEDAEPEE